VLGIAGDRVLTAVSVVELDHEDVNSEHATNRHNANSKQQELEASDRVEYQEPSHSWRCDRWIAR
jgi:hypothetical protein